MTIRILAIGDIANYTTVLRKFVKKSKIHLIAFPRDGDSVFTYADDMEFFDSYKVSRQVEKINEIKDKFDLCLTSWAGAKIAYLSDLNYIIYFVGVDIRTPSFIKNPKDPFLQESIPSFNFLERFFYKRVIDNAIACVTFGEDLFSYLKKYRKDAIRMDRYPVDITIFNEDVKPLEKEKTKFTFFSPQRIGPSKGIDIIWKAIPLCRSDFEILQVEWFEERTVEERKINQQLLKIKPPQVKLIPLIKREEIPKYYMFADAVLGQMGYGFQGGIEREAVFCKRPVIHYADPKIKHIIDGKELMAPFLPNSRDPRKLAEVIDRVVESKGFREKLVDDEYKFIKEIADPYNAAAEWDQLFEDLGKKYKSIKRNSSVIKIKLRLMFYLVSNRLYLKKIKRLRIKF